jgi:hypothetical protein
MRQSDSFDLDSLRLSPKLRSSLSEAVSRPPRHRDGEPFLKGPVPMNWLARAGQLPGKALHVAVLLWKTAGCRRSRTVRFCLSQGEVMGMHPNTARRALRRLAKAGLIEISHRSGQGLVVTLLEIESKEM